MQWNAFNAPFYDVTVGNFRLKRLVGNRLQDIDVSSLTPQNA